jgi:ABC-type multidrug transport system fused ATPase/permease subunit
VVGVGYVGLPLAVALSRYFDVQGFDIYEGRIRELQNGADKTNELNEKESAQLKNIKFTSRERDLENTDVFICCVPTPVDSINTPNLNPLKSASHCFKIGYYYSIVGPSGSGKTCLLNIISGLNDDYKGSFRINGLDFRETDIQRYWRKVSYVPQESAIFNGTIADNVALSGLPEIDRARVERSLETANFGLQKLADANLTIDSRVGTGGQKLSGGQSQRIAIARAIYKRPNILILV